MPITSDLVEYARQTLRRAYNLDNTSDPTTSDAFEAACQLEGATGDLRRCLSNAQSFDLRAQIARCDDVKRDALGLKSYFEGEAVKAAATVAALLDRITAHA